ncbi:MAG: hypothetical protein Q9164_005723, partial [Protoblastenia rupestris]
MAMYAIGDKYDVPSLKASAKQKFAEIVDSVPLYGDLQKRDVVFGNNILVYASNPANEDGLQDTA